MTPEAARGKLAAWGRAADVHFDAVAASLALAAADDPTSPVDEARETFEALAFAARRLLEGNRAAASGDPVARAGLVAALLASHAYAGDRETYDDPRNANLAHVLVRRRGLPVALGLIWIGIARRLDWPLAGIDFPGHFLLAIQGRDRALLCDAFDRGRVLDPAGLRALRTRIAGPGAEIGPDDLAAMTDRAVVLRLANNLRVRRIDAGAFEAALAITEDMRLLAPQAPGLMFAAGELALRVGRPRAAVAHLEHFLATDPPPDSRQAAAAMLDKARQSLN
jgi:regulator of sirC expression with transglutaminase-like and TPR domain